MLLNLKYPIRRATQLYPIVDPILLQPIRRATQLVFIVDAILLQPIRRGSQVVFIVDATILLQAIRIDWRRTWTPMLDASTPVPRRTTASPRKRTTLRRADSPSNKQC